MKLFKRVTAAVLTVGFVLLLAVTAFGANENLFASSEPKIIASGFCGGDTSAAYNAASNAYKNLWWKLDSEGVLTIGGTGEMKNYLLTYDSVKQYNITSAPWGQNIPRPRTLIIKDGVTNIGQCAFYGCSGFTGDLVIPDSVTSIGEDAFSYCSGFTGDLVIGNSVTSIGSSAFYRCSGFTGNLVIPNSVTSIGYEAFHGCSGFTGDLVIPDSVTSIGFNAFYGCSGFTGDLVIGNNVTSIGERAFCNCSGFTGDLVIGNNVTSIGERAFCNCSGFTGDLVIGNSVTSIGGSAFFDCSGFTGDLVIGNNVTSIGNDAFCNCSGFTGDLVIGNNVTSIGNDAFCNCSGFTGDLVIPNSVTSIGNYAFLSCSGFTGDLVIGNNVTSIGELAFYGCSGFTGDLVIGNNVTSIGREAFRGCSGFTGIYFKGDAPNIGSKAFNNKTLYYLEGKSGWTTPTYMGYTTDTYSLNPTGYCGKNGGTNLIWSVDESGVLKISGTGKMEDYDDVKDVPWKKYIFDTVVIEEGVTSIGRNAFNGFKNIKGSLSIPDSVISISSYAFYDCTGFDGTLDLGNGVKSIGESAFEDCSGFKGDLVIGNNVTSIGSFAFRECSGFTGDLVIGNNVTSIGYEAFYRCSGFESLKLPVKLFRIGDSAFRGCKNLSGDIVIANNAIIEGNAFTGCTKLENIYFMGNAPDIPESWNDNAVFEDSVTFYYVEGMNGWSYPDYRGYKTDTWKPNFAISFIANGGENIPESQIKIANTDLAISNIVPVRSGYNFKWWRGSDGKTYNPGDLYTANADLILTAVWVSDTSIDFPTIAIANTKGMAGSIVNIDVKLKNNPGISGIGTELVFDSSMLEFLGAQIGSGMAAVSGAQIYTDINRNGTVTLNWNNPNLIDFEGDYTFATVKFKIKDSAKAGDTTVISVQYDENNIYDSTGSNVAFFTESGTVRVTSYTPGDIDGDGNVSNKDVSRLFNYISKKNVEVVRDALDVNGDGSINNRDVIALFQYVSLADVEIF